jgi:hypothetical protein
MAQRCLLATFALSVSLAMAQGALPMAVTQTIALTAEGVLGARFDGIGAISGGGATSKLLMR